MFWKPRPPDPKWYAHALGNEGGEVVPDRFDTQKLQGFRTWLVAKDAGGLALRSLSYNYIWGNPVTAECAAKKDHRSPDPDCACGLYIQLPDHPFSEWEAYRHGRVSATGTVAVWGRIIICEKGMKAEHAEIISSVVLDVSCAFKEKGFKCMKDATRINPSPELRSWCDTHTKGLTVPSAEWLHSACDLLAARYEGVDFITWQ